MNRSWPIRLGTMVLVVAVLTVLPAVLHGRYSNRWQLTTQLAGAATRLERFPAALGDWLQSAEGDPLRDGVVKELGVAGYVHRRYTNVNTGEEVTLLLMVGQPGPLVRHPPDICYATQNNTPIGGVRQLVVSDPPPQSRFNVLQYRTRSTVADVFKVAYGYTVDGVWDVPPWPRLAYGGAPALYKIQMLRAGFDESAFSDPPKVLQDFADALVQAFRRHLQTETAP